MARNEEKHLTQLNRLHLQKLRDEELERNPKRPQLRYLNTAAEIQKWIPSIKREMQIALSQSQVPCYTESRVDEYRREVDRLQREYMAFVRKMKNLNPEMEATPWTSRGYRKRKSDDSEPEPSDSSLPKRLELPLMSQPHCTPLPPPPPIAQPSDQDLPLEFSTLAPRKMNLDQFSERYRTEPAVARKGGSENDQNQKAETSRKSGLANLVADYSSSDDDDTS